MSNRRTAPSLSAQASEVASFHGEQVSYKESCMALFLMALS